MLFLIFVVTIVAIDPSWGSDKHDHEYCIIGAGPGGLQMAYFLQAAKRDYIVFERASHAGELCTRQKKSNTILCVFD